MDLGVPRNIASSAAEIYNVYLYNIDDLSDIVKQNRGARESEVPKAEEIIDEHVGKFLSWQASVELVGFVAALRERVAQERTDFLRERLAAMQHLSAEDRDKVEGIVSDLLEKLLIEPAQQLRGERELRRKIQNVEALARFILEREGQSLRSAAHRHAWQHVGQMAGGKRAQAAFCRHRQGSRHRHHQDGGRPPAAGTTDGNRRQRHFHQGTGRSPARRNDRSGGAQRKRHSDRYSDAAVFSRRLQARGRSRLFGYPKRSYAGESAAGAHGWEPAVCAGRPSSSMCARIWTFAICGATWIRACEK